jgi:hypothetical protein
MGSELIWVTIFTISAFACAKLVRNDVCIDRSGVLESARYRSVLQESVFDG